MTSLENIDPATIEANRRPVTTSFSEALNDLPGYFDTTGPLPSWARLREELSKLIEKIPETLRGKAFFRVHGQFPDAVMISVTYERCETDDEVAAGLAKVRKSSSHN